METMHAAGRRRLPPVPRAAVTREAVEQVTVANPRSPAAGQIDTDVQTAAVQTAAEQITAEQAEPGEQITAEQADSGEQITAEQTDAGERTDTGEPAEELTGAELTGAEPAALTDAVAEDASPEEAAVDATTAAEDTDQFQVPELAAEVAATGTEEGDGDDAGPDDLEPVVADAAVVPAPRRQPQTEDLVDAPDPAQQFVVRLRSSAADFAGAAGAESAVVREAVPPARHRRARCRLVLRYGDGDVADVTLLGPTGFPGPPSRHGFDRQILRWLGTGLVREDAWLVDDPDAPDGVAVDLIAWASGG